MPLLANVFTDLAHWIGDAFTTLTDWLADFSSHWWFPLVILAVAFFDSVIPVVPSETLVIVGGVAAGTTGDQSLLVVIASGALGAFLGDNTAYLLGARMSGSIRRWADNKPKRHLRLEWASEQIRMRGGLLLVTARFIPGGRTALTVSSGITHQPKKWFVGWIAVAVVIWASYAGLLGYFGGKAFEDNHTKAFLVAFGSALSVTVVIEIVRHLRAKHR